MSIEKVKLINNSANQVYPEIDPADKGTEVVANPTLAGTEGDLTGLQVGSTKYAVPTPTTVVANPTLAGTEGDLTGLQVGNTKYKVGGGSKLYEHSIVIAVTNSNLKVFCTIISDSNTPFTLTTLKTFLYNNYKFGDGKTLMANGWFVSQAETFSVHGISANASDILVNSYIYVSSSNVIAVNQSYRTFPTDVYSFTDAVRQLN